MQNKKRFQQIADKKLKFFLPDWSDMVHKSYNFVTDEPISDEKVYQHQIFDNPNFDGLLVSKAKLERSKRKLQMIQKTGIHEHLNYDGVVFGDNGAYSYIDEKEPPFSVDDLLEYYQDIEVDLGVSLDHLCVPKHKKDWELRKEITIKSAGKFMDRHQEKGYNFIPIGSAQGWDPQSYYDSIKELIDMNYQYIAIGGLSAASTSTILRTLNYVQSLIKDPNLEVHLFGVARLKSIREFIKLGVTSLDSASLIRTAFKGFRKNYFSFSEYKPYGALRIPFASRLRSKEFKFLHNEGLATKEQLKSWEQSLYRMLLEFDINDEYTVDEVVEAFQLFESAYMMKYTNRRFDFYRETLTDKIWRDCPCQVCQNIGVEVIIFRGNNRNRRRGFHNMFVFYHWLQKILDDPEFELSDLKDENENQQTSLDDFL